MLTDRADAKRPIEQALSVVGAGLTRSEADALAAREGAQRMTVKVSNKKTLSGDAVA